MRSTVSMATVHSLERAKERAGYNERKAMKMISQALERGKRASDFSSWERNFLERESNDEGTALAYAGFCYIVNQNGFCITMYPLPVWFGKKKQFDGKERIRNPKAYMKNHIIADCLYC